MVLANVPLFRFSFRGNIRQNHPFGNHPFVNPRSKSKIHPYPSLWGFGSLNVKRLGAIPLRPTCKLELGSPWAGRESLWAQRLEKILGPSGPQSPKKVSRRVRKASKEKSLSDFFKTFRTLLRLLGPKGPRTSSRLFRFGPGDSSSQADEIPTTEVQRLSFNKGGYLSDTCAIPRESKGNIVDQIPPPSAVASGKAIARKGGYLELSC